MSAPAVVAGSYCDLKTIRTRQVLQMIIEIPLEQGEQLIDAFGFPNPGAEIRVAVARLVDPTPTPAKQSDKSEAAKAAYNAKSEGEQAVVRAALLARDPRFQVYAKASNETEAADYIRHRCVIDSRREIATSSVALDWFLTMETEYKQSTGQEAAP